jgi:uncharacterized protein
VSADAPDGEGPSARFAGKSLPEALRRFLELYGAGQYWDSHEALEGAWRDTGSDFYQALILYASAWVHLERGNAHGVRAQLRKAVARLKGYPDVYLGLDVAELRKHCAVVRGSIADHPTSWADQIEPLVLTPSIARVRGDETELRGDP